MTKKINATWWAEHIARGYHDGRCETCDKLMGVDDVVAIPTGFFCSDECAEGAEYDGLSEEDLQKAERQQMGIN